MSKNAEPFRRVAPPSKPKRLFDLNTDFGQTADRAFFEGKERSLLHFASSVNIPCCVHDSDPAQVLKDIQVAKQNNCAIGAHFAYPDPKHYGYEAIPIDMDELYAWVLLQLGAFSALCKAQGFDFDHVRPHGALYSQCLQNREIAFTVGRAVKQFDPWTILVLPHGAMAKQVETEVGLQVAEEVYLGKRVSSEGVLIPERFNENLPPQGVIEQARQLIMQGTLTSDDGQTVKVTAKTMHLSPKLQGNMMVAERVNAMLGEVTSLAIAAAGNSGWL